jgi:hypothetical protein
MKEITQEELNELFEYRDGALYWKTTVSRRAKKGDRAGSIDPKGYRQVGINRKVYKEHRLIYLLLKGSLPEQLDHIDRDRTNNSIENLRPCSNQENQYNTISHSSSGIKGVSWDKREGKWRAQMRLDGKMHSLGRFKNLIEAERILKLFRKLHHGEFIRD